MIIQKYHIYEFEDNLLLKNTIMTIIINIPAYNEEKRIWKVISSIPKNIDWNDIIIQVVDDWSSDNTIEVSKKSWADIIIAHDYNKWVWWAFKTAVDNFLSSWADIMVNIDADWQFDVNDIQKLIKPIIQHQADIVIASRFSWKDADWIPFIKNILNRLIATIVWILMWKKIDDLTCGFRAYTRDSLFRLNLIETFTYTQETIIDWFWKHLRIKWIPVNVKYFNERKSRVVKTLLSYISRSVLIIFRTVRDVKPLVFFWLPWVILVWFWIIVFIIFLFYYFQTFRTTPYRTWLIISWTSISIWLLLFVFASIADMIKWQRKISEETLYQIRKLIYNNKNK